MAQTLSSRMVLDTLKKVQDPDLKRDIVSLGFVKDLSIQGDRVSFTLELTTPACPVRDEMKEEARRLLAELPGVRHVDIALSSQVRSSFGPDRTKYIPQVKNIVPVASGKGGVGKSTVSVNLALALSRLGAKVGLLDADVYGPSVPVILGVKGKPTSKDGRIIPVEEKGIKVMSTAFFLAQDEAAIVRGPILHKLMDQFLAQVDWGELDYLIVDLPPGTGDVQLSLCQMIPLTGAAVVSTPQDVALRVAEKAILMFRKLNAPILGIIENMSAHFCAACGAREDIFGSGGAKSAADRLEVPFLGTIPLDKGLREASDAGEPVVLRDPESSLAGAFFEIAKTLASQISIRNMLSTVNT